MGKTTFAATQRAHNNNYTTIFAERTTTTIVGRDKRGGF